jgi:peptidyl-prolyl cis-trans isomerase SurA
MYKYLITLASGVALSASMVAGVAAVVKDKAITLLDVQKEMQTSNVNEQGALDILIRQKLEESEIKERKLEVSSAEVYEDIKQTAARNNMTVSQLYEAALNANGISSSELKEKVKQKLLAQKLYMAIAYSKISRPSENELKEYYELHKKRFSHPSSFVVDIYQSADKSALVQKMQNPMLFTPEVQIQAQEFPYDKIAPELAELLNNTPLNSFSQIIPDGKGAFASFYMKNIKGAKNLSYEQLKMEIENEIAAKQREQVLGDYFVKLRENAGIQILRTLN